MKKIYYIFLTLIIFILPNRVFADSFSMSLSCPQVVRPSENITCNVNISSTDFTINKVTGSYSYTGGIISAQNTLNVDGILVDSPRTIATLNLTVPSTAASNDTYTINLNNIVANDNINAQSINTSIRVISSDTSIKDISATGGTLSYDSSTSTFSAIINEIKTFISATLNDPRSNILEGAGEKILNYGLNKFNLVVQSESGLTKKYNINITRPDNRSSNNYLSSLMITNTNIDFSKTKTEYNLSTTASEVIISATKEDTKANISGDIGKKSLSYGLNKFSIIVTAENGNTKVYNINLTRTDTRSSNNYLKSITLSSGEIKFNKYTTTYNINVDKNLEKIKINATLDDSKSKFISGFGPKEVTLSPGNTTVYLKVINEKGELRTYTLNINRDDGRDSDSSLKDITLSDGNIEFDKNKYEYIVNVLYDVDKIKIYPIASSDKAKIKIDGKEKLKVGKNKFVITVEAENGAKSEYIIIVNRKKEGYKLSTNNYIKKLKIKGHKLSFNKKTYEYTLTTKEDSLNIYIELDDNKATYEIYDNNNLKNNSKITIKVTSENGDVREYVINIKKNTNAILIALMIVITLLTGTLIYFIVLRIKRRNKLNSMYKTKVEVIDDDFISF